MTHRGRDRGVSFIQRISTNERSSRRHDYVDCIQFGNNGAILVLAQK